MGVKHPEETCPECQGRGRKEGQLCDRCWGEGVIRIRKPEKKEGGKDMNP